MRRWRWIMVLVLTPMLLGYVAWSNIWSPLKWGVFINNVRDLAPIAFYGQVLDQQGNPVPGAEVHVTLRTINWLYMLGSETLIRRGRYTLTTNEGGSFSITGKSGYALVVGEIKRAGYKYDPRRHPLNPRGIYTEIGFYYGGGGVGSAGPHTPDPRNPVVFVMQAVP